MSGTCKFCGCTESSIGSERACAGGCSWIDAAKTVCSACLPRLSDDELKPLWFAEFTPAALAEAPPICLDAMTLFATLATIQLGLRHPDVARQTHHAADVARRVADAMGEVLEQIGPLTAEVVRRGFEGCYELPEPHTHDGTIDGAHAACGEHITPGGIILPG